MTPDLSIIIPMYNVEKFIAKAINSTINNNWNRVTFEVIIVNDESPDNSLSIARSFEEQHDNIKVIDQKNKGLGGARNTGIVNASGKYLFFLDSDDFLLANQLEKMVLHAKEFNLDVLEFGAIMVYEDSDKIVEVVRKETNLVSSGIEYMKNVNYANSACNKIYKKSLLMDNSLFFFENTFIEDAPFNVNVFFYAKRVEAVREVCVAYLQNSESITRTKRKGEILRKFINDSIRVTSSMNYIRDSINDNDKNNILNYRIGTFVAGIILMIIRSGFPYKEKNSFLIELQENKLYPIRFKSNIKIRNVFLFFTGNENILKAMFRIPFTF